ncbi:ADP-ribosyltransferase [Yersinia aldovae]|uniref:NAD(+)--protein-arginine ADP-ribosyltransferase n=1 Tax=Yersinia aldovae TaxID=29483 RepID=A0A0T9TYF1_YERAL|nr:ADP-ribosyltransferase [Yersinia aldovae]CNJ93110.1 ADP-ribosyltransferase exoenzyme [Yersinia aldovae]CNK68450.1 ADP-ribosyltransferase exoenzyme [Yersinia aldovae]CNL08829.1 ADP-ribosyltransferase exoenzyme [Yersinia aldovae]
MNKIAMISLPLIILFINDTHARPIEPKRRVGQDWKEFQHQHCKWRRGHTCKEVPEDEGKLPARTDEEIALEVGLGILSGGPTPQPRGFKFSIGKLPIKPTTKALSPTRISTAPKLSANTEKTALLSVSSKPKAKGILKRINGSIGYLLGDPDAPSFSGEPPMKRLNIDTSESNVDSDSDSYYEYDTSSMKESDIEDDNYQQSEKSKFTVIHRRSPIQESEIEVVIKEMESIYSEGFWHKTNLDIHDEIEKYNRLSTDKKISFQDYFAFRDYTEAGYVRVNNAIRSNNITPEIKIEIEQLTNALKRHSDINISLRNRSFKHLSAENTDVVYRGEVRNKVDFETQVIEEEIVSNDAFFSTTSEKEYAMSFNMDNLEDGEVNILYTIHYPEGMTYSTDISTLLENSEEARIFLPHNIFLITEIKTIDNETIEVEMRAFGGLKSKFVPLSSVSH